MSSQRRAAAKAPFGALILILVLVVVGCSDTNAKDAAPESMITVEIQGSEGVHVSGNLGDQISKEAFSEVEVPSTLELADPVGSVILSLRKVESDGLVTVRVLKDGEEVASGETSSPFGMINLTVQQD